MSLWEAWYSQDGVTVFFGTSAENQDVVMVSFIVHAPPNLVTEARPLWLPLYKCCNPHAWQPCVVRVSSIVRALPKLVTEARLISAPLDPF